MDQLLYSKLVPRIRTAFRHNLLPGIFLWIVALGVGITYYQLPAAQPFFASVGALKAQYGVLYAAIATAFFAGLVPFIYFLLTGQTGSNRVGEMVFYLLFWGAKGVEVDLFYRLQGWMFGTDAQLSTVVMKTVVDQFFYGPFWAVPTIALAYLFKESGFHFKRCFNRVDRRFFTLTVPTIVISNLLVWLPAVSVIYCMPADLQIPLFNLVQCFFSLVLNILGRSKE